MTATSKGKWAAGQSGNARGRPKNKEPEPLLTPEDLATVVMRVANRMTTVTIDGRDEVVPVYEANTIGLAIGSGSARLARKAFNDLTRSASYTLERARKRIK